MNDGSTSCYKLFSTIRFDEEFTSHFGEVSTVLGVLQVLKIHILTGTLWVYFLSGTLTIWLLDSISRGNNSYYVDKIHEIGVVCSGHICMLIEIYLYCVLKYYDITKFI